MKNLGQSEAEQTRGSQEEEDEGAANERIPDNRNELEEASIERVNTQEAEKQEEIDVNNIDNTSYQQSPVKLEEK